MKELQVSYTRLQANHANPHSASSKRTATDEELRDSIADYKCWPKNKKPKESDASIQYIRKGDCWRAHVEFNLKEYEVNYLKHTFSRSSYMDKSEADATAMLQYFRKDPLGKTDMPKTDSRCWIMREVTTYFGDAFWVFVVSKNLTLSFNESGTA